MEKSLTSKTQNVNASSSMTVIYAGEDAPNIIVKSIFLVGPSPRGGIGYNWRIDALQILSEIGYDGVVFIPLSREGNMKHSYDDQIEWETKHLHMSDVIIFWIPRNLENLPGFTTNVEWGIWFDSGKVVLGYPEGTPKINYLQFHADAEKLTSYNTLRGTLEASVAKIGSGVKRIGGEREVPSYIWNTQHFQSWFQSQKKAGNRLDGCKVLWTFRVGLDRSFVFAYALHVNVYVKSEKRNKTNEFVISRPDIATIVAYNNVNGRIEDTEIILIKEFRSPASTIDSFIYEAPGGSTFKPNIDPFEMMIQELKEETGLAINDKRRITKIGTRQLCGTLSTHKANVFAVQLEDHELEYFKEQVKFRKTYGEEEASEKTYIHVCRYRDLFNPENGLVDWSMLGMITAALKDNWKNYINIG